MKTSNKLSQLCAPALAGALLSVATPATVYAEAFPEHAIKLVVPWSPGGATDVLGRILAKGLTAQLKQTVVVENKAGAGGNIGTSAFVREKADGYSLLVATSSTNAANPHLYKRLGFDAQKDFAPVAFVANIPNVLEVPKGSRFTSVGDLLAFAKENPGQLNYGSAGVGSSQHLATSLLQHTTGASFTHIPYKGSGPAVSDLLGKQLDFMIDTGSMAQVKGGNLNALAVASKKRIPFLPDVPTFEEAGIKDMVASAWYGIVAPTGTPADVVDTLNKAVNNALKDPQIRAQLEGMGAQVVEGDNTSAEFGAFIQSEITRYAELVKMSGAKPE